MTRAPIAVAALVAAALTGGAAAPAPDSVDVFFPRGAATADCGRVVAVHRSVARPAVLRGALRALVAGPSPAERRRGYGGWFSARTAAALRSVRLHRGVAYIDLRDLRRVIPNASSSCGSALLLAQLNRTATQFPTVRRAVYSFAGSRSAFYEWLQQPTPR
jgi:hypothetical protein